MKALPIVVILLLAVSCPAMAGFDWDAGFGSAGRATSGEILLVAQSGASTGEQEKQDRPSPNGKGGSTESDAETKHGESAVHTLKKRILELQNRGKLGFRKLVMCSSVDRFGEYSPLKPGTPISTIILYIEPSNYGTLITKDRYIIDCTVDVAILREDGKLIAGKEGILRINRVSRSPVLDLYYRILLRLKKPLKRGIVIRTRLRDNVKSETATASYRIDVKSGKKVLDEGV